MISLPELAARHWRALSLGLHLKDRPPSLRSSLALYTIHFLGLLAVVRITHQPLWLGLIPVLLIQPLAVSWRLKSRYLLPESLAPLVFAYGVLFLRLFIALVARIQGLTAGSLSVPDPWGAWLNLNIVTGLSGLWALMAQAGLSTDALGRRIHWKTMLGCVLALLSLGWSAITYLTIRSAGVTGSDPYAYVQMAVDLAGQGTPLHTFPLAVRVAEWGLPIWPVVPIGYNPPDPATGMASTVWAPGYSAFLALGSWMGGETAYYVLTPLFGLVTLVALWWLCLEVTRTSHNDQRFLAAGVAVFVLATSYEQVDRLSVPMADIPAQLFTILTIYFALRAMRGRTWLFATLSGLALGVAFAIRYTQVLLGFSILLVWALDFVEHRRRSWRVSLISLVCFGSAAWLVATPVLWYHKIVFGGPFRVGWSEAELISWQNVPVTIPHIVKAFTHRNEYLYLLPFLAWGFIRGWLSSRQTAIALLAWLLVVASLHLSYAAVRIRDLLSVFPVLSIWTGVGIAELLCQVRPNRRRAWRKLPQLLGLGLVTALLYIRTHTMLRLPIDAPEFSTFGHLRSEQRAAFEALADLTPSEAIVATSLNSGPVGLYANRDAVRPAYWSQDEWLDFLSRALTNQRPVYMLADGIEMRSPLQTVRSHHRLRLVSFFYVPYFYPGGSSDNLYVPLYEVVD